MEIDQADNGVAPVGAGHLSQVVEASNPVWDGIQDETAAFLEAVAFATAVLMRATHQAAAEARAASRVLDAVRWTKDPRLIVLDQKLPWEKAVFAAGLTEALFVIYPNEEKTSWYCRTVPPEPGSFGQRLSLPAEWGGLRDEEFSRVAGVPDGVFCHPSLFICAARSQNSALALAQKAMNAGSIPPQASH